MVKRKGEIIPLKQIVDKNQDFIIAFKKMKKSLDNDRMTTINVQEEKSNDDNTIETLEEDK